jgi:hypothetical protein
MSDTLGSVRPTRRCLADLEIAPPPLTVPLHSLDHVIVQVAQQAPELLRAGGQERVRKLNDRVWFKVKTSSVRAIVTELREADVPEVLEPAKPDGRWWIGASGHRQEDSHHDFYKAIERECTYGNSVSSTHLLPTSWDEKRLVAEQAIAWRADVKRMVIRVIAGSLRTGSLSVAEYSQHRVMALVRADNGAEAYLAIVAEGIPDPNVFALILDCVPGVEASDWQPEPGHVAGIEPTSGQIIWSTLFPPSVASAVLELAGEEDE